MEAAQNSSSCNSSGETYVQQCSVDDDETRSKFWLRRFANGAVSVALAY